MHFEIRLTVCFVVMAAVPTIISSEVFSSVFKVERMMWEEKQLLNLLKDYIDLGYKTLNRTSQFYLDRLQYVRTQPRLGDTAEQRKHPNAVYKIIKQFAEQYNQSLAHFFNNFYNQIRATTKHQVPILKDITAAAKSLLFIQTVYKLSAKDMANGDYQGFLGPTLSHSDAYFIGQTAFLNGKLNQSIDWLNTSLDRFLAREEMQDGPSLPEIRGLLGRAYLYMGNFQQAEVEYNKSGATSEDGGDVLTLRNELESPPNYLTPKLKPSFQIFSSLCRMENRTLPTGHNPSGSACRYRDALLPYYRFKEEILSVDPFIVVVHNVTTNEESDSIIKVAKDEMVDAEKLMGDERNSKDPLSFLMRSTDSKIVFSVSRKIEYITGLRLENEAFRAGAFQIVNYGVGGYSKKVDYKIRQKTLGDKIATVIVYLSDVEKGGATVFPHAGKAVAPVKNMALMWYNFKTSHELDPHVASGECPVMIGEKWIATRRIWSHDNIFRRRCGLTPKATQLDVEMDMKKGYKYQAN